MGWGFEWLGSAARLALLPLALGAALASSGCQRCINNFDCGEGSFCRAGRCETECFTDEDCRQPPECAGNPVACRPKGLRCSALGRCFGDILPPQTELASGPSQQLPTEIDGFDDEPGNGVAFVINSVQLADDSLGFNVDGRCDEDGCIDNVLGELGSLSNNQIDQGIKAGDSLLLIELAGLENPYQGNERSMTVKLYGGQDADDPINPADNFTRPPGATTCCNFNINPQSLRGVPGQARARSPALITNGRLESLAPVTIEFTLTIGTPPHPEVRISSSRVRGIVPADLTRFNQGLLGGALPVSTLATIDNPYCRAGDSTQCPRRIPEESKLIDLASAVIGPLPDIDVDGDGLECVMDTDADGLVETCCDGNAARDRCFLNKSRCEEVFGPSGQPSNQCALNPDMLDGYSVAITFTAVAANILGTAE